MHHLTMAMHDQTFTPPASSPQKRLLARLLALLPSSDLPGARQKTPCGVNRWVVLLVYVFYTVATSAVFYGWTALSELIFRNGGFAHLCYKNPVTGLYDPDFRLQGKLYICDDQDAAVQRLYTITFAVCCTMSACAGTLLDGLGPLLTALLGQIFNVIGWLLFSFSSSEFSAYYAAFVFVGLGSDTSFLPTLTIRRLFPGSPGLIITILGSAASLSFGVPLLLTAAVKNDFATVRTVGLTYCALGPFLCVIIALVFIPRRGFSVDNHGKVWSDAAVAGGSSGDEARAGSDVLQEPSGTNGHRGDTEEQVTSTVTADYRSKGAPSLRHFLLQQVAQLRDSFVSASFWKQLFSVRFVLIVGYFVVVSWSIAYYQQAARRMFSPPVVRVMEILLPFSFIPCIILGKLADIVGIIEIIFVVNSSGVLMYALSLARFVDPPGYLSVIFFTIYMSLFTSQVFVYIEETFSPQHFGKLIGIASMVGGLLSLTTNPLYEHVTLKQDQGNPLSIQIVMTVLLCIQYATIAALFVLRKKNPKVSALKEASAGEEAPDLKSGENCADSSLQDSPAKLGGAGTDVACVQRQSKKHDSMASGMFATPAQSGCSASTESV